MYTSIFLPVGVHQSHSALKQHTGLLENALAQRETVVAELSAELNTAAQDRANENLRLQRLVKDMGVAMEKDKQASQDAKKQVQLTYHWFRVIRALMQFGGNFIVIGSILLCLYSPKL